MLKVTFYQQITYMTSKNNKEHYWQLLLHKLNTFGVLTTKKCIICDKMVMKLEWNALLAKNLLEIFVGGLPRDWTFNELILRLSKSFLEHFSHYICSRLWDSWMSILLTFSYLLVMTLLKKKMENMNSLRMTFYQQITYITCETTNEQIEQFWRFDYK